MSSSALPFLSSRSSIGGITTYYTNICGGRAKTREGSGALAALARGPEALAQPADHGAAFTQGLERIPGRHQRAGDGVVAEAGLARFRQELADAFPGSGEGLLRLVLGVEGLAEAEQHIGVRRS